MNSINGLDLALAVVAVGALGGWLAAHRETIRQQRAARRMVADAYKTGRRTGWVDGHRQGWRDRSEHQLMQDVMADWPHPSALRPAPLQAVPSSDNGQGETDDHDDA